MEGDEQPAPMTYGQSEQQEQHVFKFKAGWFLEAWAIGERQPLLSAQCDP